MKQYHIVRPSSLLNILVIPIALLMLVVIDANAFPRYKDGGVAGTNCAQCHGDFTSPTSPKGTVFPSDNKHEMHRASGSMNTECNLCHTSGDNRNPFLKSSNGTTINTGLGCTGCHEPTGLRAHHAGAGITSCSLCHADPTPPAEGSVFPPYYGTADTNVNNPCNLTATPNLDENWSIGDSFGLDNDGDGLYDFNDPDCAGPKGLVSGFWPGRGAANDLVFIFGDRFYGSTGTPGNVPIVRFNGVQTFIIQVASDDLIIAFLPAGETQGLITVETDEGVVSSPSTFGLPIPSGVVINGIWPSTTGINQLAWIFGENFDPVLGGTQVTVNGVAAGSAQVVDQGLIIFITQFNHTSGPVCVTASGMTACSSIDITITP